MDNGFFSVLLTPYEQITCEEHRARVKKDYYSEKICKQASMFLVQALDSLWSFPDAHVYMDFLHIAENLDVGSVFLDGEENLF